MICNLSKERPTETESYMCIRQIAWFRVYLQSWRELLISENIRNRQQLNRESQPFADILDQSVENAIRHMAAVNGQRSRQTIRQIDAALQRIEQGSFGYCLRSGEEIGLQRLLAWPIATLSVEAQEYLERKSRHFRR